MAARPGHGDEARADDGATDETGDEVTADDGSTPDEVVGSSVDDDGTTATESIADGGEG